MKAGTLCFLFVMVAVLWMAPMELPGRTLGSVEPSAEVVKSLRVRRAGHVAAGNVHADESLSAATSALKGVDSSGDVSCDVRLRRSGDVTLYNGDGIVRDASDFNRINGFPGNAKIVASIHWCGYFGSFNGCARNGGTSFMVIANMPTTTRGQFWAHEYGHNKGLFHRTGTNAVMNPNAGRIVSQSECDAFRE